MTNYLEDDIKTINSLNKIGNIALKMAENIQQKNNYLIKFAKNMTKSYKVMKKMYPKFTNEKIEKIIKLIQPYIEGYMICGAGNGGFLEIIIKKNISKEFINQIITENIKNKDVKVWDSKIIF